MTSDSASAVKRASTCPYEATSTIAWLFGSSPGVPGPSGQRTRSLSAPILNAFAGPRDDILNAAPPRGRERRALVRALAGNRRIEDAARHADFFEHLRGAPDVIPLRMREDEQRQARHTERAAAGTRDFASGGTLVDQHRAARDLDQRSVALADVEERDAQAVRRRQQSVSRGGASLPRSARQQDDRRVAAASARPSR